MDPNVSQRLFADGGTLILLDVPEGTEVGIDYNSWNTGPRFKGIKMIPPGFHFVYYSAVSKEGQTAPRTGFFHFFHTKEVVVKRWDPRYEELSDRDVDDVLIERLTSNLRDLDPSLGPYPYDSLKKWTTLTNHLTPPLVERIKPVNGAISSVTQVAGDGSKGKEGTNTCDVTMTTELPLATEKAEHDVHVCSKPLGPQLEKDVFFAGVGMFPLLETTPTPNRGAGVSASGLIMPTNKDSTLRFSEIPRQKHPDGAAPTEVTLHNMDLSYTLETFLENNYSDDVSGILGELQLAFICFMVGQVYEAFEQWKRLVHLLCSSEQSLLRHAQLFISLVSTMHFQLKEIPEDFFVDIVSRDNFLTKTLQVFFSNVSQCEGVDPSLSKKALQFRDHLTKRYQWDFTSEPEEDAPTIVDLN